MLRINLSTQSLEWQLDIAKPQINLKSTLPAIQLDTEAATLEISSANGELSIDQTPCRYSLGIKNQGDFTRDFAEAGHQAVLEGIARMAQEGDQLADISNTGGEPIVSIAMSRSTPSTAEVNLGWIDNPIISYQPKQPEFTASDPQLSLDLNRGRVENDFRWGTVALHVTQYPKISMWTTGNIDMQA